MKLDLYQVDAFASDVFEGNPAAVVPLDQWPETELMQKIASENNLSETAFIVQEKEEYRIRWFTPTTEVDLCGHATLAAAHVLFNHIKPGRREIQFTSRSGRLHVVHKNGMLWMDFPSQPPEETAPVSILNEALEVEPVYTGFNVDYLVVVGSEKEVRQINPDFSKLSKVNTRGIIVTARGDKIDFVSRFFGPSVGVDEDPVTGSAHTVLTPYWAEKLGKQKLQARQISKRGGDLKCILHGDRVSIAGKAATYLQGTINIHLP